MVDKGKADPLSPFIFDESFAVDPSKVLLVVYYEGETTVGVWMPQFVTENMSHTFSPDVLAAVKDFLDNVPRKGIPA